MLASTRGRLSKQKKNIKFHATDAPSPRWFCTNALSRFPRIFNGRILEVPIDLGRSGDAPSSCQNPQRSPLQ